MIKSAISVFKKYLDFGSVVELDIRFYLLVIVLAALSMGSIDRITKSSQLTTKIAELRVPTSQQGLTIINGVNSALANLRGWMLIGDAKFKTQRAQVWKDNIHAPLQAMRQISQHWVDLDNISRFNRIEMLIPQFERAQQEIEDIANTQANTPALQILVKRAAPLTEIISQNINQMIQLENRLPATPERKTLLGTMANVSSSIGFCVANLQDFLILGDKKFELEFEKNFAANQKWFDLLTRNKYLLTLEQKSLYDAIALARKEFLPFPKQMIAIRNGASWNVAVHWLKSKANPLGQDLSQLLVEMVKSQKKQLDKDAMQVARINRQLEFMLWGLFAIGVTLAIIITRYVSKERRHQVELEGEKAHLDAMSNCSGLKETCDVALQRLSHEHSAIKGLLYYVNNDTNQLHLGGLYGVGPDKVDSTVVIGDGVLGQTFVDRIVNRIDCAKAGLAAIDAGTMQVLPEQLLTFPLSYNNVIIAVAQFSCVKKQLSSEEAVLERKLQTTARFIHDAMQEEDKRRQLELLDQRVIISSTDMDGVITSVSTAFANVSGYKKEEMIGLKHSMVRHPDMDASLYEALWRDISSGQSWHGEIKNLKRDGGYYWVDAWISPVFDLYNNITGYTAVRSDITDKKTIEELSITDGLTGIYNRRHFDTIFQHQLDTVRREGKQLAFAIMDIDYFKPYNDNYGHQMGDETLQKVAEALKSFGNRPSDYVFRLGGEEFGALFLADDLEKAEAFGKRINAAVSGLQIPHAHSKVFHHVTVSIGLILILPDSTLDVSALYKKADQLLYEAKEGGRNRVVCNKVG
jgi:diguanylate cyclase (GGDEF)-like protein/PAS domain S-box-containing protein